MKEGGFFCFLTFFGGGWEGWERWEVMGGDGRDGNDGSDKKRHFGAFGRLKK